MNKINFLKTRILLVFFAVFALAPIGVLADLTLTQIENGKKATALVQVNITINKNKVPGSGRGIPRPPANPAPAKEVRINGSAFCINPDGWFVTCSHLFEKYPEGKVKLILNAGEKDQTILEAKIVRFDKNKDLALLKVNNHSSFNVLQLGSVEGLVETVRLTAFGYPFGENLALDENTFPAISVSTGAITSLRKKDGKLEMIQLDASLNPGNSGGPVLNSEGRVIGIVNAGIEGAALNFAIPVSQLQEFLSAPDVEFFPPTLTPENIGKPAAFKANILAIAGKNEDYQAELTLTFAGSQHKVSMKRSADGFITEDVPAPPQKGPLSLLITATSAGHSLSGTIVDMPFAIAGKTYQLGKVQRLEGGAKPSVVLDDGTIIEGTISGLSAVSVKLDEMQVALDLAKATSVTLRPIGTAGAIEYQATINRNGKPVKTVSGIIPIGAAAETPSNSTPTTTTVSTSPAGKTTTAQLGAGQSEVKLPSDISDVAVGGGGKYLVLYLRKVHQFAIFDTNTKTVKNLPVDSDDILFTAGAEKLIVVSLDQNIISRYNLKTLAREATAPMPIKGTVNAIAMGSNSLGPLLVLASGVSFLDPNSLALKSLSIKNWTGTDMSKRCQIRTSADGSVFSMAHGGASFQTIVIEDNEAHMYSAHDDHSFLVIPGPDGRSIYATTGLFTPEAKMIGDPNTYARNTLRIPATHGDYYIEIDDTGRIAVCLSGDSRTLITLPQVCDISDYKGPVSARPDTIFPRDKRIFLIPDARLIIGIPKTNDRLILQPFDLLQALKNTKIDYLYVSSSPITSATKNSNYVYQIQVESKRGGVKFFLDSGPSGMNITPTGKLTWTTGSIKIDESVIVRITDATEQEIFHTFKIGTK
jgi:hypothetical protein